MNTRPRRFHLLAAVAVAVAATGCGMFGSSSSAPVVRATGASPTSTVVLYHVRLGGEDDSFIDHSVYLNGTRVGRVNPGEELRLQVAPGVTELRIQREMRWLGSAQGSPLTYSIETPKGPAAPTRYMRYRTATGEARMTPVAGTVLPDRELGPVTELDYSARN